MNFKDIHNFSILKKRELPMVFCLAFLMACSGEKKQEHPDEKSLSNDYTALWDCGEYKTGNPFLQQINKHRSSNGKKALEEARKRMEKLPYQDLIIVEGKDAFPMWYLQEVESFRTDLKIVNRSLLDQKWYRDQLKRIGVTDSMINTIK